MDKNSDLSKYLPDDNINNKQKFILAEGIIRIKTAWLIKRANNTLKHDAKTYALPNRLRPSHYNSQLTRPKLGTHLSFCA